MKIAHYVPAYNEQINAGLRRQSCQDAVAATRAGHDYHPWDAHSCDLLYMRNHTLHEALRLGMDYLFMQDSDVYSDVPGGALMPLLATAEETGATITGAMVTMRTNPPRANVWPCRVGEVFEADKIGTGMVLLNLAKIREWYEGYDGPCFSRVYETDKGLKPKIGSDIFFSYVVRQHGGLIVCDGRVPTVHVNAVHRLRFDGESIPEAAGQSAEAIGGHEAREVANG